MTLTFTALVIPVGAPRLRAQHIPGKGGAPGFTHLYTPAGKGTRKARGASAHGSYDGFRSAIAYAARGADGFPEKPIAGPVSISWDAYFPRPQRLLKKSSPTGRIPHAAKPDRDNIDKGVLDALKRAQLLLDDAQVCGGELNKWYVEVGGKPRVEVVVEYGGEEEN